MLHHETPAYMITYIRGQQWLSAVLHLILSITGGDGQEEVWKAARKSFRESDCFRAGETFSLFNFDVSGTIFAGLCCWNKQNDFVITITNTEIILENKVNYTWRIWPKNITTVFFCFLIIFHVVSCSFFSILKHLVRHLLWPCQYTYSFWFNSSLPKGYIKHYSQPSTIRCV